MIEKARALDIEATALHLEQFDMYAPDIQYMF